MNIAVLGYGRQGKKHVQAWKNLGYNPDIFCRNASLDTLSIDSFDSKKYQIIVVAIYPISEQTRMLEQILANDYSGYLIIEKPITYSEDLLLLLGKRQKTIFFIDELFISPVGFPRNLYISNIEITTSHSDDYINVLQHAIGLFLSNEEYASICTGTVYTRKIGPQIEYRCMMGKDVVFHFIDKNLSYMGKNIDFNFSRTYTRLLKTILDDNLHFRIRENYIRFMETIDKESGFALE